MFTATFIIKAKNYNREFHDYNNRIDELAKNSPGYLYKEKWQSADGVLENVVYYWETMESIMAFSKNELHNEAKARFREWYFGYKVIIAEVVHTSENGSID
jgi:heme-degrading monooxygenase HmoA